MSTLEERMAEAVTLVAIKKQELSDAQVALNKLVLERIRVEAEEYNRAQGGWGKFLILEDKTPIDERVRDAVSSWDDDE